jgi:hypothetical protein
MSTLVEEPRSVTAVDSYPVLALLDVLRDVGSYEIQLVLSRKIPKQLAEAAERLSPHLRSAKARSRSLNLEKDADEFAGIAPAASRDKIRAGKELRVELAKHVIEDFANHAHLGDSPSRSIMLIFVSVCATNSTVAISVPRVRRAVDEQRRGDGDQRHDA